MHNPVPALVFHSGFCVLWVKLGECCEVAVLRKSESFQGVSS